ncbi:hypothetical protein LCGC14_1942990 [marine sediment metagenome]|uniref:Uncharacterized protein n=1 Tax=marine sediment metagenome TaxID=412755 RepID=A0A0F9IGW5_9ZZZZ
MTYTYRQTNDNEFWIENVTGTLVFEPVIRISFFNSMDNTDEYEEIVKVLAAAHDLLEALQDIDTWLELLIEDTNRPYTASDMRVSVLAAIQKAI